MPVIEEIACDEFICEPSAALPRESVVAEECALQSENEDNEDIEEWGKSFRRYLDRYQIELHRHHSEVLSNKVKIALLEKCSEAESLTDVVETYTEIKGFRRKMSNLYNCIEELRKRKSVYEKLMNETAILKATLRKEYHIKSLQDFVPQYTVCLNSEEFITALKASGKKVYVKIVNNEESVQLSRLIGNKREMDVMKQLDHPNILQIYDSFVENDCYYVVSELYLYILGVYVAQAKRSEPNYTGLLHSYVTHICEALLYLKSEGIILDQLDVQNIKITKNGELKIDVLSSSPRFINSNSIKADHSSEKHSTNEVDTYALGHLLHYMFMGCYPLEGVRIPLNQLETLSKSATELIKKMLVQESHSQFIFEDVLRHPFFEGKFEDKLVLKDDSSLLIRVFKKYKLLLESALEHKLRPFISDKSRNDLFNRLDNVSNWAAADIETGLEVEITRVFFSCQHMFRLFKAHEALQEELWVFANAIRTSRAVIFELKETKQEEYCAASSYIDSHEQEVTKWENLIAKATLLWPLPVSCEMVKKAYNEFIDRMPNEKVKATLRAEITSLNYVDE